MTSEEWAELNALRERVVTLEALTQHQGGMLITSYNALWALGKLALDMNAVVRVSNNLAPYRSEDAARLDEELGDFNEAMRQLFDMFGVMDELAKTPQAGASGTCTPWQGGASARCGALARGPQGCG